MTVFLLRRAAQGGVVLWLSSVLIFGLFYLGPHDPAAALAGRQASPEAVALVSHRLGLDRPVYVQYGQFLLGALRGDLGQDYYHGVPVSTVIAAALPKTLSLAVGSSLLCLVVGVGLGLLSSSPRARWADRIVTGVSLLFFSVPAFLLGLLLLYGLYYRLTVAGARLFPPGGYVPVSQDPLGWARSLALPWLTLTLAYAAPYIRLTRASMREVGREDYVRTARAKGLSRRRITFLHVLRNALTPVTTQFGVDFGQLVGGIALVEVVFSIDGLGRTAILAMATQNLPVIIGTSLVAATGVILASMVTDALYVVLDRRRSLR